MLRFQDCKRYPVSVLNLRKMAPKFGQYYLMTLHPSDVTAIYPLMDLLVNVDIKRAILRAIILCNYNIPINSFLKIF